MGLWLCYYLWLLINRLLNDLRLWLNYLWWLWNISLLRNELGLLFLVGNRLLILLLFGTSLVFRLFVVIIATEDIFFFFLVHCKSFYRKIFFFFIYLSCNLNSNLNFFWFKLTKKLFILKYLKKINIIILFIRKAIIFFI